MKKAILLSGGIDSVALCYWLRPDVAITIDYGQLPAPAEIEVSRKVCKELHIPHEVVTVDCRRLGSGDLAGTESLGMSPSREWWPYRNQLLATIASMKAIGLGVDEIIFGSVKSDSFHADGTFAFYTQLNNLLKMQEGGLTVSVPAITMSSGELVIASGIPSSLLCWAHSCHISDVACGNCRGCFKHQSVMHEIGYGFY
ncbi:MAG: 7-cyano-7-deazaguanine synthase [Geobacter sp.]|nr:MAG: 7-cyano-7-deazaguanine synthase [Geobacter sp.]